MPKGKRTKEETQKLRNLLIQKQTELAAIQAAQDQVHKSLLPALEQEQLELAKTSFKAFFKQSWKYIEPGVPYIDSWHIDAICSHLQAVKDGDIQNLIIQIPPRHSKQCSKDTPILTVNRGWTTHGDLKINDFVFHPSGKPTKIIWVSPNSISDTKITFTNGEEIYCNKEHLWEVWSKTTRKTIVEETQNLIGKEKIPDGDKERYRFFLRNIAPLYYTKKELPLDPYYFGNWLGDGSKNSNRITQAPEDYPIIENIPYKVSSVCPHNKTGVNTYYFSYQQINQTLKQLKVWGNKHIPTIFKESSIEQRKELIAGIIDSDGSVDKNSRVRIVNCNKKLIDDIYEVLVSLGQRPYIEYRPLEKINKYKESSKSFKQDCWVVGFQPTMDFPTVLERKKIKRFVRQRRIAIKKIEELAEKDTKIGNCITVDSEDGLYLVGKTCIPTHNSTIVSVAYPCWTWISNPSEKFITASAIEKLVLRDAVRSRRLINTEWYKSLNPELSLLPDVNQKHRYENNYAGYRLAVAIKSGVTGEGYDTLLCDDLIKAQEANNRAAIENALEWWTQAMPSRSNTPDARRVLIMQRLSTRDPIGWELDNNPELWTNLCLPMEFDPNRKCITEINWEDPRKEENEIICPQRFPDREIKKLKASLGSIGWATQYLQNPVPIGGNIIRKEWIKYYSTAEAFNRYTSYQYELLVGSCDLTFSDTGESWTVGQVWGKKGANYYLLNQYRGKMGVVEQLQMIRTMKREYPQIRTILVEKMANGDAVIAQLQKEIRGLVGIKLSEIGGGDKQVRLALASLSFESGNVYFPHPQTNPWINDVIDELTTFPRGESDDICDATSMFINWISQKAGLTTIDIQASSEDIKAQMKESDQNFEHLLKLKQEKRSDVGFTNTSALNIADKRSIFS